VIASDSVHRTRVILAAIVLVAVARVASTHRVFSQTSDEWMHVATGIEWLAQGSYTIEPQHPPLARVSVALGLFLEDPTLWASPDAYSGPDLFEKGRGYTHNLTLARWGVVPYWVLLLAIVWLWSRELLGATAALWSTAVTSTLPPLLGHAGLATTDLPFTAMLLAALYAAHRWITAPTWGRALVMGVAAAAALAAKFSFVLYFPLGVLALAVCEQRVAGEPRVPRRIAMLGAAVLAALVTTWGAYRCSFGPLAADPKFERFHELFPSVAAWSAFGSWSRVAIPAPELLAGLFDVTMHNQEGHLAWLDGKKAEKGWWYYFPVALALKTPLPFLLLSVIAGWVWRRNDPQARAIVAPIVAAIAILGGAMCSNINIGIRHILIVLALLSIGVGAAVVGLWRGSGWARAAAAGLLLWQVGTTSVAHPDYMAYFNELAGDDPGEYLLDSNLDWGQDILRLAHVVKCRGIVRLSMACFSNPDPVARGIPYVQADLSRPVPGWLAVSDMYRFGMAEDLSLGWLSGYSPVQRVGRSIRLYYIPDPAHPETGPPPTFARPDCEAP
jgi:hypothetical protein